MSNILDGSRSTQLPLFSRFLDTNGDGTGTKNANGDFSITPGQFFITPAAGQTLILSRLIIQIVDTGAFGSGNYGAGITLTNGIRLEKRIGASTTDIDLVDNIPVITNIDWARFCFDTELSNFGAGENYLTARWTFARSGVDLTLNGNNNERCTIILNDNFTGLVGHFFLSQGRVNNNV